MSDRWDELELGDTLHEEDELEAAIDAAFDYSVIGPVDNRFQIRAQARRPSTLQFPFNTICLIEELTPSGPQHRGTGTLIAPQVVLTAKHVLQNISPPCAPARVTGPAVARVRVTPGADFSAGVVAQRRPSAPASITAPASRFRVDPNLDYGVIILPRPFTSPNRFMWLQARGSTNTATLLTVAGYPCDKPLGTMWGHSDQVRLANVTPTHLRYSMDTCPGHSGSPIWLLGNDGIRLLLGVHTTGAGGPASRCPTLTGARCAATGAPVQTATGLNCGVRVTCHVIRFIETACRAFRVRGPTVDRFTRRTCA
jgi:glutamyl endopeptidase